MLFLFKEIDRKRGVAVFSFALLEQEKLLHRLDRRQNGIDP
jgi:hypothetical protein